MSTPAPVLDVTVRCKSLTAHDTTPPAQNARLQLGDVATDYLDIGLRGALISAIQPGKTYHILIQEVEATT